MHHLLLVVLLAPLMFLPPSSNTLLVGCHEFGSAFLVLHALHVPLTPLPPGSNTLLVGCDTLEVCHPALLAFLAFLQPSHVCSTALLVILHVPLTVLAVLHVPFTFLPPGSNTLLVGCYEFGPAFLVLHALDVGSATFLEQGSTFLVVCDTLEVSLPAFLVLLAPFQPSPVGSTTPLKVHGPALLVA